MLDNVRQDFRANGSRFGAQGFWALVIYRFGRWRYGVRPALLRKFFSMLYKILFKLIQIFTGIELPCEVEIGRHFSIDHFGGIIISGYAKFGNHCRVCNDVVVGLRGAYRPGAPIIGDNVDIGAGAKLLGPISMCPTIAAQWAYRPSSRAEYRRPCAAWRSPTPRRDSPSADRSASRGALPDRWDSPDPYPNATPVSTGLAAAAASRQLPKN
jgi:serine O-acetyltransferase